MTRRSAIVRAASSDAVPAAIEKIEALGASENKTGRTVRAQHYRDTDLIGISVTARSAQDAADSCNRIAVAYVAGSGGKAVIIEKAEVPMRPID